MDYALLIIILAMALAYFTNVKLWQIAVLSGTMNVALNLEAFRIVVEPPWWAWIFPWLYSATVTWNYLGIISNFVFMVIATWVVAYIIRWVKGRGKE